MKWIVGIDLQPDSDGSAHLASWLSAHRAADACLFVHVLEEEHLRYALMQHHLDEVVKAAREAAEALLARTGATGEIRVVKGRTVEETLEEVRLEVGAGAVAVGRAAGREGVHLVRLGRVARRLLGKLSSPVAVVPPDLRASELGDGPIVALSNLSDGSAPVVRFAGELAGRMGRPLAAVHVARKAEASYLPKEGLERAQAGRQAEVERALSEWLASRGLAAGSAVGLVGSPVEASLAWAQEKRAPLVVAGSRQLSGADRVFHTSTGLSLASAARVPVVIVPPKP